MKAPRLNDHERGSVAWQKVDAHTQARLTMFRATCENPNKSEAERYAAAIRVNELKELLKLAQPALEQEPQDE